MSSHNASIKFTELGEGLVDIELAFDRPEDEYPLTLDNAYAAEALAIKVDRILRSGVLGTSLVENK